VGFTVKLIQWNAIHRTDLPALGCIEMPDALGAQIGVYLVNLLALGNGMVRTLRLAYITVYAGVGDLERH
jgi:hypothetical protein